jgi:hypothetical protein
MSSFIASLPARAPELEVLRREIGRDDADPALARSEAKG